MRFRLRNRLVCPGRSCLCGRRLVAETIRISGVIIVIFCLELIRREAFQVLRVHLLMGKEVRAATFGGNKNLEWNLVMV